MPVMHPCYENTALTSACEATKAKGYVSFEVCQNIRTTLL
uniref:Uncharacterized protein n=1 Tax=Arundo donax TaxID=35708 RepID=A0A0A9HTF2_ARUDO